MLYTYPNAFLQNKAMAKMSSFWNPSFFLLLVTVVIVQLSAVTSDDSKWCVAKQGTRDTQLQANIDFVCKIHGMDCRSIFPGPEGFCSTDTLETRAAYAMSIYYISKGLAGAACDFNGSGIVTSSAPKVSYICFIPRGVPDAKWCVAKQETRDAQLQANIDFACKSPDGFCSKDTLKTRAAAYAMTAYYTSNGLACNFNGSGIVTTTSPSSNTCFISGGL